jgi:hypothetical protein
MLAILKRLFDKLGLGNPQKTKGTASGVESHSKANGSNAGDVADDEASKVESITPADPTQATPLSDQDVRDTLVAFDENLLEKARTQWQFGDWETLAEVSREQLQHHPDRAKLAILVAAGHSQLGSMQQARQFTRLADDWGASKKLISQVLISGVHNSLALVAGASNQSQRALSHFDKAISVGMPNGDAVLLTEARRHFQLEQIGIALLPDSRSQIGSGQGIGVKSNPSLDLQKLHFRNQSIGNASVKGKSECLNEVTKKTEDSATSRSKNQALNSTVIIELMGLSGVGKSTILNEAWNIKNISWIKPDCIQKIKAQKSISSDLLRKYIDSIEIDDFVQECIRLINANQMTAMQKTTSIRLLDSAIKEYALINISDYKSIFVHDELLLHKAFSILCHLKNFQESAIWYFSNCPVPKAVIILQDEPSKIVQRLMERKKTINTLYQLTEKEIFSLYNKILSMYQIAEKILESRGVRVYTIQVQPIILDSANSLCEIISKEYNIAIATQT